MNRKTVIIGIGGSMEPGSSSLLYLKYVLNELKILGAEVKLVDIKKVKLPLYNYSKGLSAADKKFRLLLDEVHKADGLVFASPEYHGSVSSSFKNIIDHFEFLSGYNPPYLTQKPAGCIALAGAENSGAATLAAMVSIVHSLRAIAASNSLAIGSAYRHINEKGDIKNASLKRKLKRLAKEVYDLSIKLR